MPVERVAIFDCALSTGRQAERGRQKLRIYAFHKNLRKWESVAYFQIGKLHFTLNQYIVRSTRPVAQTGFEKEISENLIAESSIQKLPVSGWTLL